MPEKSNLENQLSVLEKYAVDYKQLLTIYSIIKDCGLTPTNYSPESIWEEWDADFGAAIPIANEGAQGVRVVRRSEGFVPRGEEGLIVTFTNGFEDPKNPKRVELTEKLRENRINVV